MLAFVRETLSRVCPTPMLPRNVDSATRMTARRESSKIHDARRRGGYTLLEVLVILLVLGALAAVLVPQYGKALNDTQTQKLKSSLRDLRFDIAQYRSKALIDGRPAFPSHAELVMSAQTLRRGLPLNPYTHQTAIQQVSKDAAKDRSVVHADQFGWNYFADPKANPPIAVIYANCEHATSDHAESGDLLSANRQ